MISPIMVIVLVVGATVMGAILLTSIRGGGGLPGR